MDYIGRPKLADTWYWSSTEYSLTYAWFVDFSNGLTYNYYKCFAIAVRAVAAF